MALPLSPSPVDDLLRRIGDAVQQDRPAAICQGVKTALEELSRHGGALDERLLEPVAGGYGRRLLHRDPAGRFTVVVMAWGPGQGTPVHDHSGLWCVECVYRGRIRVHSYRLAERLERDLVRFELEHRVDCGIGQAGALIPPFDYHVIENPHGEPAATVHVYGGDMTSCAVFWPEGDLHRCERRQLHYTETRSS